MILEILSILSLVVVGFGSDPPKPPPAPTPPPDTEGESGRARLLADQQRRRGRRSTILAGRTAYGLAGMDGPSNGGLYAGQGKLGARGPTG